MKTTGTGWFLAVTMLAGLLTAPLAIAEKEKPAKVRMQAVPQSQLVVKREATVKERVSLVAPGQWPGLSNGFTMPAPPVANGPVWDWKMPQATSPQNVSRGTVVAGIPDWIWCMLHFCKRQ